MLLNLISQIRLFLRDDRGVTTLEYGILAAGVAVVIGMIVSSDGIFYQTIETLFNTVLDSLPSASSAE